MRRLSSAVRGQRSEVRPPTAYRLPPTASRRGLSLLEVLISTFILAIGLLGLAALIPVGQFTLMETGKADRASACGRAALRETKVRRLLDYNSWTPTPNDSDTGFTPVVIDPLGRTATPPLPVDFPAGSGLLSRKNLQNPVTLAAWIASEAEIVFSWHDDLVFDMPKDDTLRPGMLPTGLDSEGNYSWFLTVSPAPTEAHLPYSDKRLFTVSAVACYKRDVTTAGEHTTTAVLASGYGGGSVTLGAAMEIAEGEWILLYNATGTIGQCHWYRVVAAGESPTKYLSLTGPDWIMGAQGGSNTATAVIVDTVAGVYTAVLELDQYSVWNK